MFVLTVINSAQTKLLAAIEDKHFESRDARTSAGLLVRVTQNLMAVYLVFRCVFHRKLSI